MNDILTMTILCCCLCELAGMLPLEKFDMIGMSPYKYRQSSQRRDVSYIRARC